MITKPTTSKVPKTTMPKFTQLKWRIALALPLLLLLLLTLQTPSHEGPWNASHARLPDVQQHGESVQIQGLRDFRYHVDGRIADARYLEQSFDLAALERVWLGISHFGKNGLAHTFLSFEFADGQYLAVSVEARQRPEQSYHPLRGMLRQYHKIIVLGTEQDIVGLRSHIRGERVLLYPLQLDAVQRRHVLQGILADVTELAQQPGFYHTLIDNCTTSLLRHDPQHKVWRGLLDYRILLPGHSDAYAVERGWLEQPRSLSQLRREAQTNSAIAPTARHFSERLRQPDYQRLELSMLVMQAQMYDGSAVSTSGVVRGFDDPEHYWLEDNRLNRIALHPKEQAREWLGQRARAKGRFYYQRDEGRQIQLDELLPLAPQGGQQ